MVIIGVICCALLYMFRLRRLNVDEKTIDRLFIIALVAGLFVYLGASFFDNLWHSMSAATIDGVFHPELFKYDSNAGGVTFEGGIITGLIVYIILFLIAMPNERKRIFIYLDQIALCILIAHAFGRIGCFLGGCCYGKPTDSIFGMMYPTAEGWMKVFPTQLYESAFLFLLFFLLVFLIKKNRFQIYLISYGVFRFLLEYLRGDDRGTSPFGALSPSQFMSIIMIAGGIAVIIIRYFVEKKAKTQYELAIEKYNSLTEEEKINSIPPKKYVSYYTGHYGKFFKGVFRKRPFCPKCAHKMSINLHGDLSDANSYELLNTCHYNYKCKNCGYEIEINDANIINKNINTNDNDKLDEQIETPNPTIENNKEIEEKVEKENKDE